MHLNTSQQYLQTWKFSGQSSSCSSATLSSEDLCCSYPSEKRGKQLKCTCMYIRLQQQEEPTILQDPISLEVVKRKLTNYLHLLLLFLFSEPEDSFLEVQRKSCTTNLQWIIDLACSFKTQMQKDSTVFRG